MHARYRTDIFTENFTQTLHGKWIFSTIDLIRAYNQISVNLEDVPKAAISSSFEFYEFLYVLFATECGSNISKVYRSVARPTILLRIYRRHFNSVKERRRIPRAPEAIFLPD